MQNLNQQALRRFLDILDNGSAAAVEYEKERLQDPGFGLAFASSFEWVPAFRASVVDGSLSIQAARWWSIEHVYDPVPHMQQVNAQWVIVGAFGVKLTCE